jgi:hypothetical protein
LRIAEIFDSISQGCAVNAANQTRDCPRVGLLVLTVEGRNFGRANAKASLLHPTVHRARLSRFVFEL